MRMRDEDEYIFEDGEYMNDSFDILYFTKITT